MNDSKMKIVCTTIFTLSWLIAFNQGVSTKFTFTSNVNYKSSISELILTNSDSNEQFKLPIAIEYDRKTHMYFFVMPNSNYELYEWQFRLKELREAKIIIDSVDHYYKIHFISSLTIYSKKRNKTIMVFFKDNFVYEINETKRGKGIKKYNIKRFDINGNVSKTYQQTAD
jgi:hypothetical protein